MRLTTLGLDQRGVGAGLIGIVTAASAPGIRAPAPFISGWLSAEVR